MSDTTSNSGSATPQFRVDENTQPFRLGPRPATGGLDGDLLDQTRNQIRELVEEIAGLAKSGCSQGDFFEGFLTRTTRALASSGGVVGRSLPQTGLWKLPFISISTKPIWPTTKPPKPSTLNCCNGF